MMMIILLDASLGRKEAGFENWGKVGERRYSFNTHQVEIGSWEEIRLAKGKKEERILDREAQDSPGQHYCQERFVFPSDWSSVQS